MAPVNNEPIVARQKLLPDNSAAEFIETRPGRCLGVAYSVPNLAEFSPQLDKFVPRTAAELRVEQYYEASKQKSKELELLLTKFAKLVEDRVLDREFNVQFNSLKSYKMTDILNIADKIQRKHQDSSTVRDCTGVFRKCFERVGRNQGTLANLLGFIPSDSYGSIICGGFSLVLTALERAEKLREDIYAALAEIPRKLELINSLTDCHRESIEMYQAGDVVLLALFCVLERIVNELTKRKGKKALSLLWKGKSYGSDREKALKSLEDSLLAFRDQVQICNSRRLGEIRENQARLGDGQARLTNIMMGFAEQLSKDKAAVAALKPDLARSPEDQDTAKRIQANIADAEPRIEVINKLYSLFVSSPIFDARKGCYLPPVPQQLPPKHFRALNEKIIGDWLQSLPLHYRDVAIQDMKHVLEGAGTLSIEDQGKVQYIMASTGLLEWLKVKDSQILLVQSETAPHELINPLSFCSAFLVRTLRESYGSPVLYYNCGYRTSNSLDEDLSEPVALLDTFNAELASHLLSKHGDDLDLASLSKEIFHKTAAESRGKQISQRKKLFKSLIKQLPDSDNVFIVIDGLSRVAGPDTFIDQVCQGIMRLCSRSTRQVKIIITDVLSRGVLERYAHQEVFVNNHVDSGGQTLNLQFLHEDTQNSLHT